MRSSSTRFCLVFFFVACYSIATVNAQGFSPAGQISEGCFNCLCEASSECDVDAECFDKGPGLYVCGPYHISYNYWKEAGKPGEDPDDPLDFEKCLNSKSCSEATIRGYMYKWGRDCDGDQRVDCFDWARIHRGGPHACNSTWVLGTHYWSRFDTCYRKLFAK